VDDTQLTPALERVAASVAETQRKRQQVEEDLKAAASAVASLHEQSSSLEQSVLSLRQQLEATLRAKSAEDGALAELVSKRRSAIDQLDTIARDIEAFISDKEKAAAEIASHEQAARRKIDEVGTEIAAVKQGLVGLGADTGVLRDKFAEIRKAAEAAQAQLADVESKARELDTAADGMAARVCGIAEGLESAQRERNGISTTADELRAVGAALVARRKEAHDAATELDQLLASREQERAALAQAIEKIPTPPNGESSTIEPGVPAPDIVFATRVNEPVKYNETVALLSLLTYLGFVDAAEATAAAEVLHAGDVDRLVRSMWSRAMGGPVPGFYCLIIGSALSESGDVKVAMTFFNKALESKHVDPFATYLVAIALLRLKRYVDVLRIAQVLGRAKNGKVLGKNIEALHMAASGRADEAEKKLTEALSVIGHPKLHYNETMYNLACLAQRRGDARTAVTWFERLAAGDPSYRDISTHMDSLRTQAQTA
jgi:tetratricopeptide (TPR) repeat protein